MDIAARLKEIRESLGVSQYRLAKDSGVAPSAINKVESGNMRPTVDLVEKLCDALGVSLSDFFNESPADTKNEIREKKILNATSSLSDKQVDALHLFLKTLQDNVELSENERTPEKSETKPGVVAAHLEGEYGKYIPGLEEQVNKILDESTERKRQAIRDGKWKSKRNGQGET